MEKSFDPSQFEGKWYAHWEQSGCFKPSGQGPTYTIMLPPPNVTGTLHMGHAFQHTLQDALIRYHRMKGFNTLWQMGTDHAGIATEMVVGRNLAIEGNGETRDSLGREKFIEKVWDWKQESGDTITRQMRRMGASGDWSRERFTMDEGYSEAVIETFVKLFEQGLIYRGQRLVNWDPVLKTAISDLEVVSEEENGFMWSISYPLADGSGSLVVATTRPETLLGDTAVMVHPEDERYAHLIGKMVTLPLCGRVIPIIADEYVDREFGTGVVKVTPAHDFNDYAVGQRHSLPMINILTFDAKINDNAPEKYRGLDVKAARKMVLADLTELELLVEEKPHKLQVPRGDRTGQIIEPYLTDQWFVKMDTLAARGLELVENSSVKFVPENWINTYRHWMSNIQDWCISRQLWWGHRIPAWYDEAGKIYVGHDENEVRANNNLSQDIKLQQDNDVLETWFSSSLWSHATLGWPNEKAMAELDFAERLPTSVLVTGFDIIFFWVARMIMMTDHFTGTVPFKDVYVHGLVRDKDGQKMSKSKGNVLDPIDIIDGITLDELIKKRTSGLMKPTDAPKIEKATIKEFPEGIAAFGADALRFTFASLATHGRDIKFDMERCGGYKNFCNKLWNAARFVLMHCENFTTSGTPVANSDSEKWIHHKLFHTLQNVEDHYANYRFDLVSTELYEFTWNNYCDWFLEFAKPALQNGGEEADGMRHTMLSILEILLRALHPIMPFITEEIWQNIAPKLGISGNSISTQSYPDYNSLTIDSATSSRVEILKGVVTQVRSIRSQMSIPPSKLVPLIVEGPSDDSLLTQICGQESSLKFLARLESVSSLNTGEAPPSAMAPYFNLKLHIPMAGLIDLSAEKARLAKELKRIEIEINKCQGKLSSETFVANAPEMVVAQERQRLLDWQAQQLALGEQFQKLN